MAYKTLYRVFRPQRFEDVYGQEHITDILKKQIETGQTSHAYLFYGPRGTGKTSTAKIFANAINCQNPKNGSPCLECEVCKSVAADSFVDISEIDAASNNGVDNVRDIREKVSFLPTAGKFKVYIIDEVHMMSTSAFNALLKTLEEPPAHAIFILATTEIRKVPATILSRCQRYDFKRITQEDIVACLKDVAQKTDAAFEEEAIVLLARAAEGAMRDALSLMDRCIAAGAFSAQAVGEAIGSADSETVKSLCDAVLEENPKSALAFAEKIFEGGTEAHNLLRDIVIRLTELLKENVTEAYACAKILRALNILIGTQMTITFSPTPQSVLICAILRACNAATDTNGEEIELRLKKLERRVEKLGDLPPQAVSTPKKETVHQPSAAAGMLEKQEIEQQKEQQKREAAVTVSGDEALEKFKLLAKKKLPALAPMIAPITALEPRGNILDVYAREEDRVLVEMLKMDANMKELAEIFRQIFGHEMAVELIFSKEDTDSDENESIERQLEQMVGAGNFRIK